MKTVLAITVGKLTSYLSQKLKIGGGSAAPGLFALKIDPDLVTKLAKSIPRNIIITGTNGKTTTARLLAQFAKQQNLPVIRNQTGSNLERGIASALIQNSKLSLQGFKMSRGLGIWELDEAAFNTMALKIKPDLIVFLNVFRDQLDRYGEVNTVINDWCHTLKKMPLKTNILVNGDDISLSILKKCFNGPIQTFGVENYKITGESTKQAKISQKLDFKAKNIKTRGLSKTSFQLLVKEKNISITLPLPGIYHIYDFLAAIGGAMSLDLNLKQAVLSLSSFSPAFGRFEQFEWPRRNSKSLPQGYICLIKNPAGTNQILQTITPQIQASDRLLCALNDNLADGTDVSWIWDAQWEALSKNKLKNQIICSGIRTADLTNRLKYAGIDNKQLVSQPDLEEALKLGFKNLKGRLFILLTYTTMLELQKILTKKGVKKHYWKEEL